MKKDKWYVMTERALYSYPSTAIRIDALRGRLEEIKAGFEPSIIGNYELREGKDYVVGNKVESAVLKRLENSGIKWLELEINNLERVRKNIGRSVEILDEDSRCLVELVYWKGLNWERVCNMMAIDKNTYYRIKNRCVKTIAYSMGYMTEKEYGKAMAHG